MKKRKLFKAVVLTILTLSIMSSSLVFVSADTVANGTVLLNEDMLKDRSMTDDFTITNGGTISYTQGQLKVVGGGSTINCFDLTGVSLGLGTDITSYTVQADLFFDTLASNLRCDFGVRERSYVGVKNQDNCTGISVVKSGEKIKTTAVNRATNNTSSTKVNVVTLDDDFLNAESTSKIITCKIVVNEGIVSHYVCVDGGQWQAIWESEQKCGKDGEEQVLFFSARNGCTVTIDNLLIYAGTGDAPDVAPATTAPWGLGYQLSDVYQGANGTVANIRFVALGVDMNVENVGFKISASIDEKSWNRNTTAVYSELWGKDETGVSGAVATASEYGAEYIYGLAIMGIPTDTDIVFTVTPYATKGGETKDGATFQVTVNVPSGTAY